MLSKPAARIVIALSTVVALVAVAAVAIFYAAKPAESCVEGPANAMICVASDMARLPNHGPVPIESPDYDIAHGPLRLSGAQNEVLGFQVIVKATRKARFAVSVSDLGGPGKQMIDASAQIDRFLAWYLWLDNGGYTWGPKTKVLDYPDFYPDALVPFRNRCGDRETIIEDFEVPSTHGKNQAVWVDVHIPRDQKPGLYTGNVLVVAEGDTRHFPIEIDVRDVRIPDTFSVEAVGELYDTYRAESVEVSQFAMEKWAGISHCYHQMAQRHRTTFIERFDGYYGPRPDDPSASWDPYVKTFGPVLDGSLFTAKHGYDGPGVGQPVQIWRPPWVQAYNGQVTRPLSDVELAKWKALAVSWGALVEDQGWGFESFAYIFDEVDGPTDQGADASGSARTGPYIEMVHGEMKRVQAALDEGSPKHRIDLLWTSHTNPAAWQGRPGEDLAGTIRLWAPNAGAADVPFLKERKGHGERVWFYHDGHPFIGAHAINVPGADMRTWGVVTARYGLDGHFMWAVNLSDPENPYNKPSYKSGDDRVGNGALVYPGASLATIGHPPIAEPVPSMRLKAWRRGLQDAELIALAKKKAGAAKVDPLVQAMIPRALSEGEGGAAWPSESGPWLAFHRALLNLAE